MARRSIFADFSIDLTYFVQSESLCLHDISEHGQGNSLQAIWWSFEASAWITQTRALTREQISGVLSVLWNWHNLFLFAHLWTIKILIITHCCIVLCIM